MDHKLQCKTIKCLLKALLGLVSGSRKRVLRHSTKNTEKKLISGLHQALKVLAHLKTVLRGWKKTNHKLGERFANHLIFNITNNPTKSIYLDYKEFSKLNSKKSCKRIQLENELNKRNPHKQSNQKNGQDAEEDISWQYTDGK